MRSQMELEAGVTSNMMDKRVAGASGGTRLWLGGAMVVFVLALALAWAAQRRLDALLERFDAQTLDESAKVLDKLLAEQRKHLSSTIGVVAEDSRIRAMVLTPTFDKATVLDLLTDLKATSGASVIGILDSTGTVRAVVGAPEMDQLNLGTSSLVQSALEKPAAQLLAFANKVGVLSVTPVRLDNQVRALFMLGFELEDDLLKSVEQTVGATGAVFVGDAMVASASRDADVERDLRAAAELPPGGYDIVGGAFLATSSRMSESAATATVGWLVPLHRHAAEMTLLRALSWLPTVLVGLVLALMIGLVWSQSRPGPARGN